MVAGIKSESPAGMRRNSQQAVVGVALPAEAAGDDEHFMHDALVLADDDRANLHLSGRLRAGLLERAQQARRRRVEAAERLLLKEMRDRSREKVFREGGRRLATENLPPFRPQRIDVKRGYACDLLREISAPLTPPASRPGGRLTPR